MLILSYIILYQIRLMPVLDYNFNVVFQKTVLSNFIQNLFPVFGLQTGLIDANTIFGDCCCNCVTLIPPNKT